MVRTKTHRHVDIQAGSLERHRRRLRVRRVHAVRRAALAVRSHLS
jgi:hypothetical protein